MRRARTSRFLSSPSGKSDLRSDAWGTAAKKYVWSLSASTAVSSSDPPASE